MFQMHPLPLRWFEALRNMKLNQSRHRNLFLTEQPNIFPPGSLSKREIQIAERGDSFCEQRKRCSAGLQPVLHSGVQKAAKEELLDQARFHREPKVSERNSSGFLSQASCSSNGCSFTFESQVASRRD
jgi:hypothetical protein